MLRINLISGCSEFWLWRIETEGLESAYKLGNCTPSLEEYERRGRGNGFEEERFPGIWGGKRDEGTKW